jgi:hypothetical protein
MYGEFVRKNLLVPHVSTEDCVLHVLIFISTTSHKKGVKRKIYAKVIAVYLICTILLAQHCCVFYVTMSESNSTRVETFRVEKLLIT